MTETSIQTRTINMIFTDYQSHVARFPAIRAYHRECVALVTGFIRDVEAGVFRERAR